jgi:predicted Zn-dependent protease
MVWVGDQTVIDVADGDESTRSVRAGFDVSGLFYNIGRRLGRAAIPAIRKTKWIYDGLAGSEEEALQAESRLGTALAAEVRTATQPARDPALTPWLAELCQRLAACVRDKKRTFHCEAIQGESPNAMALPGGFVFLSHTLVELCERCPDELAFVIGHEMGHIIRRHAWDRMLNEAMLRVASVVSARTGVLGGWLRQNGQRVLQSAHSRDRELEADELGLRLAVAARFAPGGAIALLKRIEPLEGHPDVLGQYFASHPPASERMAHLRAISQQLSANQGS